MGLAAAVNGLQPRCYKSKGTMVRLSDSHSTGIWKEEGWDGRLVCLGKVRVRRERDRETIETARRDRFLPAA